MNRGKYRICFAKTGDLRFLSHHDLIRLFERMMRRAQLPFRSSEGFHPLPTMTFASALGLGIVGRNEVLDIELTELLPEDEVRDRLAGQCPPGLEIRGVEAVPLKSRLNVRRNCFRVPLDPAAHPDLPERISALLAARECRVERLKPQRRTINVRPFIRNIELDAGGLTLDFHVTPNGSARPDEVLALLGLGELLANGAVLERTVLEIENYHEALGNRQQAILLPP